MTKRDYLVIARSIKNYMSVHKYITSHYTVSGNITSFVHFLCDDLEADNPKFDREKFIKACGLDNESN